MPSSVIHAIYYDKAASSLRIIFVSGSVYEYLRVPQRVYEAIKTATSKGKYFNRFIKNKYAFNQIR